jgi:hypothetical protein
MAFRKNTLLLLILISTFSIFIASISEIISVNIEAMEAVVDGGQKAPHLAGAGEIVMSSGSDHVVWFLQVF